jgi:hypothetical protein
MTHEQIKNLNQFKYSETVLTSSDGQSIYVVAVSFHEDLGIIEEAIAEKKLKEMTHLKLPHAVSGDSETASNSSVIQS